MQKNDALPKPKFPQRILAIVVREPLAEIKQQRKRPFQQHANQYLHYTILPELNVSQANQVKKDISIEAELKPDRNPPTKPESQPIQLRQAPRDLYERPNAQSQVVQGIPVRGRKPTCRTYKHGNEVLQMKNEALDLQNLIKEHI
ncbi:hypothetical protein MCX36_14660, partial [Vibrio aestuarianus]|uniref:hypothetical protein n=1 Tax=Vibrio aestuarianus TaxID=28171 RepID=UPI00237C5404